MKMSSIHNLLLTALMTPDRNGMGVILAFEGQPGGGKTQVIMSLRLQGFPVCVIIGASCDPTDVNGMPAINADGTWSSAAARWVHEINKTGGVIFLDEWTNTTPAVQASLQRALSERVFGGVPLHPEVRILAAQNPIGSGGNHHLSPAVLNRICILPWPGFSAAEYAEYLRGTTPWPEQDAPPVSGVYPATVEAVAARRERERRFRPTYEGQFPAQAGRVAAFVTTAAGLVRDEAPAKGVRAWATRRSVETAMRFLVTAKITELSEDLQDAVLCGLVGDTWATSFRQWESTLDLPDPYAVLTGTVTYRLNPDRADIAYAVLSHVTAVYMQLTDWEGANANYLKLLRNACEAGFTDIVPGHLRQTAGAGRLYDMNNDASMKLFRELQSTHLKELLDAAGLQSFA